MKMKRIKQLTVYVLIICGSTLHASLLEKAKILDEILGEQEVSGVIVNGFDESTSVGNAINNILRYGRDSDGYRYLEELLEKKLGEYAIKQFSVQELKVLKALHDSGGENASFAIRIICLACGNDLELRQEVQSINQRMVMSGPPRMGRPAPPPFVSRSLTSQPEDSEEKIEQGDGSDVDR